MQPPLCGYDSEENRAMHHLTSRYSVVGWERTLFLEIFVIENLGKNSKRMLGSVDLGKKKGILDTKNMLYHSKEQKK